MHLKDTAILFATHQLSEKVLIQYTEIENATSDFAKAIILYHLTENKLPKALDYFNVHVFNNNVLTELGYIPLGPHLIPGNNHFSLLDFFLKNRKFKYYWYVEYDVSFSGDWSSFFKVFNAIHADFISANIDLYENIPTWHWWPSLKHPSTTLNPARWVRSFNPIYRLSLPAISFLNKALLNDWRGHHEAVIPTILYNNNFQLLDIGGEGPFVSPQFKNKFYTNETFRWRPVFETIGKEENKLYHPVK